MFSAYDIISAARCLCMGMVEPRGGGGGQGGAGGLEASTGSPGSNTAGSALLCD